jgi:hypothetical protein
LAEGFFHASPNRPSFRHFDRSGEIFCVSKHSTPHCWHSRPSGFPYWDEPTLLKTLQCTVFVGEKSLQQQVLQAVPVNGVYLAPFETAGSAKGTAE